MNLDYVSIGRNPPEEVNAIIEVPIGGEPIAALAPGRFKNIWGKA